ncbi:MAG: amino acid ABC transporter permease [Chloroflexi bacterium]|nr:MAG: amino acid ABC transporter permease [Chloroflexota bacterium]
MSVARQSRVPRSRLLPITDSFSRLPYWLLLAILIGVILLWGIINDSNYRIIFYALQQGVTTTIYVSIISYILAMSLGLLLSLMRVYKNRVTQEVSSFYIEIMRGVPMLVLLYYISFVGAPALVTGLNWIGSPLIDAGIIEPINIRNVGFTTRAILALTLGYSAFIAEIFRSGILSIEKEQTEAGQMEGASYWQIMRFILLPQAVRNIFPALGNEFIAILKDSALVSVLGVQDITQLGKVYSASTFRFFETYNIVAFLYLVMTTGLAMLIRYVERRLNR